MNQSKISFILCLSVVFLSFSQIAFGMNRNNQSSAAVTESSPLIGAGSSSASRFEVTTDKNTATEQSFAYSVNRSNPYAVAYVGGFPTLTNSPTCNGNAAPRSPVSGIRSFADLKRLLRPKSAPVQLPTAPVKSESCWSRLCGPCFRRR